MADPVTYDQLDTLIDTDPIGLRDAAWREIAQLRRWVEWIAEVKDDECRYDHHGYCQAHNLNERPCPMEGIHKYVAAVERAEA